MLHHGEHAPVPTILRLVAGITYLKWAHFVHIIVKCLSLNLCYLCSIVNYILAHVIWNSFSFHFIRIKIKIWNSGCKIQLKSHRVKKTKQKQLFLKNKRLVIFLCECSWLKGRTLVTEQSVTDSNYNNLPTKCWLSGLNTSQFRTLSILCPSIIL